MEKSGQSRPYDAHHITFEPNLDGTINCHATSFDRTKERLVLCDRITAEGDRVLLCQVFIQDHRSLDPVGLLKRTIPWESDVEGTVRKWRETLHANFRERHMVMIPPNLLNKHEYDIVFGRMYLSNRRLRPPSDERYPAVVFSTMPSRATTQSLERTWYSVGIYPDLYLSMSFYRMDGTLQSSTMWGFEEDIKDTPPQAQYPSQKE
jgi:hypothetical protein